MEHLELALKHLHDQNQLLLKITDEEQLVVDE
jgi:hypothetical protein